MGTSSKTYIAAEWAMVRAIDHIFKLSCNHCHLGSIGSIDIRMVESFRFIGVASCVAYLVIHSHFTSPWGLLTLVRSLLLYIVCIMSFIWRTAPNSQNEPPALSDSTIVKIRIGISILLGLAVVYTCLIATSFRKYGNAMDSKWTDRIEALQHKAHGPNTAYAFHDSPNGSIGSPTAVMTPLRGDSSMHSSPGQAQVHFRDEVSLISSETGSPPAHSPLSLGTQTREVANTTSNHGDAHDFDLGHDGHQAMLARTHQEGSPLPHDIPRRPYDTSPSHTPEARPSEVLLQIPIHTRILPVPPSQAQPAQSSKSHSSERESLTVSSPARLVRFQPSQGDLSEVALVTASFPMSLMGMHSSMVHAQEGGSSKSHSEEQDTPTSLLRQ